MKSNVLMVGKVTAAIGRTHIVDGLNYANIVALILALIIFLIAVPAYAKLSNVSTFGTY